MWPVWDSSTCPFRMPVRSHCAANCFCERRAISIVSPAAIGSTRSEIRASSGLIQNIIARTPTMVATDVII